VYEGIKLLVPHHKMRTAQEEFALFYADQNHKNKMAWVPTTDAQVGVVVVVVVFGALFGVVGFEIGKTFMLFSFQKNLIHLTE
jgi:hypothetical protein